MADGRMLKKQISRSKKLAALKTDSARMLYTWIIPHLDIEGRLEADPFIVKGEIVPRLTTFTPENIQEYLEDMVSVGLIHLYHCDDDQFLELVKFKDHQSLRESKESRSRIPARSEEDYSRTTPDELPDYSRTTPDEVKLSKDKLSKDKKIKKQPLNLPSEDDIENSTEPKIMQYIDDICFRLVEEEIFTKAYEWKQKQLNLHKNYRAILHGLNRLYIASKVKPIDNPWAYLKKIIEVENGNYNEAEYNKAEVSC